MGRSPKDLSSQGPPNGSAQKLDDQGNLSQKRHYGADGRAIKDIDYGHDHTGVGDPHAHDWDWNKEPPRQPPRALKPGE